MRLSVRSHTSFASLTLLGVLVLGGGLAGCAEAPPPEPVVPRVAKSKPAKAKKAGKKSAQSSTKVAKAPVEPGLDAWADLAATAPTGSLQKVHDDMVSALRLLARTWQKEGSGSVPGRPLERRRAVARVMSPALGLLRETWERAVKDRPELGKFEAALKGRAEEIGVPQVDGSTTLGWLLIEFATAKLEKDAAREPIAELSLSSLRWATSVEDVYQTTFDVLGPAWTKVPSPLPSTGPWFAQSSAVAAFGAALVPRDRGANPDVAQGAATPDGTGVFGVQAAMDGRPGHASLVASRAVDVGGSYGAGNAVLDGSELVKLSLDFQRSGAAGSLFSESLVPTSIPDCMVVTDREVEFPEVPRYGLATVATTVLVSGRCAGEQRLKFAARSSYGDPTNVTVSLTPRGEPKLTLELRSDFDLPGSSVEHEGKRGLVAGAPVEFLPIMSAPGASEVALRGLKLALDSDSSFVEWTLPKFMTVRPTATGFALDDDADLRMAAPDKTQEGLDQRDTLSVLGNDRQAVWFASEVGMQHLMGREATTATKAQPRVAGGVRPNAPPADTDAWLAENVGAGVNRDQVLGKAAATAATAVAATRAAFGEVTFVEPTLERAQASFQGLLERGLLREKELKALLDRFELAPELVAKIAGSSMVSADTASALVTLLIDKLDARAATAAAAEKSGVRDDDQARGIGARVALSGKPAAELEAVATHGAEAKKVRRVAAADRKLVRALIIADLVTKSLTQAQARRVLELLNFLEFDVREAPAAVQRAVTAGLLLDALGVTKTLDPAMVRALTSLAVAVHGRTGKGEAAAKAASDAAVALGSVHVKRWNRLPLVVE